MQSMNFAVEVMFCFSSLAMRQLKRHLHFISDALKSIHTNKQSPKSGDPAERKRLQSYTIDSIYQGLLTKYKLFDLSRAVSVELLTPFL